MWRFPAALVLLFATVVEAQFCPTDWCVRGGGPRRTDCLVQWAGIRYETTTCVDGSPCDLDGAANGSCRFALAPCLDVFNTCSATPAPALETLLVQPGDHPAAAALQAAATALASDRPGVSRCGSSVPVDVPLGGGTAPGKLVLKIVATGAGQRDRDLLRFRCLPAGTQPSFAADVAPILAARCTEGCHGPGGSGSGVPFTPDAAFVTLVPRSAPPGRPRGSVLMIALRSRMPPGCFRRQPPEFSPGGCPTRAEIKTIADWIALGSPNS